MKLIKKSASVEEQNKEPTVICLADKPLSRQQDDWFLDQYKFYNILLIQKIYIYSAY